MHPLISAWLAYVDHLDAHPVAWGLHDDVQNLNRAIELSDWFNTLRRLPHGHC